MIICARREVLIKQTMSFSGRTAETVYKVRDGYICEHCDTWSETEPQAIYFGIPAEHGQIIPIELHVCSFCMTVLVASTPKEWTKLIKKYIFGGV